jgi:hypothetical protein
MNTVIPNLERFPDIGRPFLDRPARSVEVRNGLDALQRKLTAIGEGGVLCEYVLRTSSALRMRPSTCCRSATIDSSHLISNRYGKADRCTVRTTRRQASGIDKKPVQDYEELKQLEDDLVGGRRPASRQLQADRQRILHARARA